MEFLVEYGMFLAKAITIIASFGAVLVMIVSASHRKVSVDDKGELTITALNDDYEKTKNKLTLATLDDACLLYTSPSPRDGLLSRMPSSA